jgi:hypothetical protein
MSEPPRPKHRRLHETVRRLLKAVDHVIAVAREIEAARDALDRESARAEGLRLVPREREDANVS